MNLEEKKEKIRTEVTTALAEKGFITITTCPGSKGEVFGWDMLLHYALEWFQRNPPPGWHISRMYKFECYDWTITCK
jgi:hypothetical protein